MATDSTRSSLAPVTELIDTCGDPDAELNWASVLAAITEMLDSDVAVVCGPQEVLEAVGLDREARPDRELLTLSRSGATRAELPGVGPKAVVTVTGSGWSILVARSSGPFTEEEVHSLNTLGRVIGMAITTRAALEAEQRARLDLEQQVGHNRQLLSQLRERQGLLDRLFRIQQSISHRSPTQDVLDGVTTGALDLLDVSQVTLRLIDLDKPDNLVLMASQGFGREEVEEIRVVGVHSGCQGVALNEGRLVVDPHRAEDGTPGAMMASPVSVGGNVVGCLTVSTIVGDRRFTPPEQEALIALAQHASLALQDARATDAMRSALDRERHRAEHDPLTGLPNRATVKAALAHRIGIADKVPIVLLFVDLDRFKLANDTLGHAFGDKVIRVVADRLRTSVREADVVGRLAGDEFVVICEGVTEVGAIEFAERLQTVISEPIIDGHIDHVITASVGIARAYRGDSAEQVLANADLAMYRAKEAGRSMIEVFDEDLREAVEERMIVSQDLRRALVDDEFVVHLQPVVDLPTRRVVSYEALARWEHPSRGLLEPSEFIPLAEETGLIPQIDRAVLGKTIDLLGAHSDARPISANVSARSFADPTLVDWIAERLSDEGILPSRLIIEVTETVLMNSSDGTTTQLEAMRDLGLTVMIDDFGTGYSSLAYLQTFDVDGVKIDRGFVGRLGADPRADAIVAAVFSMADALDFVVVAEGVETDEQMNSMLAIRDRAGSVLLRGQGYLFGRPVDGESRLAGFVEMPSIASIG